MNSAGCALGEQTEGREELLHSSSWEREVRNASEQLCSHPGQCRRKAGGAPDAEQQLPTAQERPVEEQAVPCSQGGAPVQQWVRPGGAQPMDIPQQHPRPELQPEESSP